jgi:hypothetical protein
MFSNTHATVGQSQGSRVLSAREDEAENNCKMQIANCKLQNGNRRTFPLRPSALRLGLSLTEVLISMGILTVGLLGVASVFPVASFYMQKGDVADRGSAIAQAAFNDLISSGILNPKRWLMWEDGEIKPATPAATRVPVLPGSSQTYTRQFSDKLLQQLARLNGDSTLNPTQKQWNVATEFGAAYVIDPIAAASINWNRPNNYGTKFPATTFRLNVAPYYPWWQPWYFSVTASELPLSGWPVRRMTLAQAPLTPMSLQVAQSLFTSNDDLTIEVPSAGDRPSTQKMQLANMDGGAVADDPLTRQSRGDYSWIATVSPGNSDARDGLASNPTAFSYEVSVAVFYKRIVGQIAPRSLEDFAANLDILMQNERLVNAKVISTGLNGGELLLEANEPSPGPTESPFAGLKVGNWYFLAGPHPSSSSTKPMFVARWYRVLAIEGKDTKLDARGAPTTNLSEPDRRLVSLRGPQWPWQPTTSPTTTELSNTLCFAIIPNVVAVHAKTVQLEGNSAWSMQ